MISFWGYLMAKQRKINNSSVIRQKAKSQDEDNKKSKHGKFSKKRTFLTPWYANLRVDPEICSVLIF